MIKQTPDGIQVMKLFDVDNAIVTASASITTGTASTLISGDSDYCLDLIKIQGTTTSTVAMGTTGFNIALINDGSTMINFPFGHTNYQNFDYFAPLKQNTKNTPWIVDMDDVTGATVNITAWFVKRTH